MDVGAIYREVGAAVASRRKVLGLTQSQLADRLNTSRASVANIEVGRQKIMLHQVYALAECLELRSITELIPTRGDIPQQDETAHGLEVWGADVTDAQKVSVERLLSSALAADPMAYSR